MKNRPAILFSTGLFREKAGYFKWMLDEYVGNVYIADLDTYELLYLNQASCDTLGLPLQKRWDVNAMR